MGRQGRKDCAPPSNVLTYPFGRVSLRGRPSSSSNRQWKGLSLATVVLLPALWLYVCIGRCWCDVRSVRQGVAVSSQSHAEREGAHLLPGTILVSRRGGGMPTGAACDDASVCACGFLVLDAVIVTGGRTR